MTTILDEIRQPLTAMPPPHNHDDPTGPAFLADGTRVMVRAIRPDDDVLLGQFHEGLSDRSVLMRYFHNLALRERADPDRLQRICRYDPDRELVLVVETEEPAFLGVGRWNRMDLETEAELAVIVADRAHRRGVGTLLVRRLLEAARLAGLRRVIALVHPENREMLELCRKFGPMDGLTADGLIRATLSV